MCPDRKSVGIGKAMPTDKVSASIICVGKTFADCFCPDSLSSVGIGLANRETVGKGTLCRHMLLSARFYHGVVRATKYLTLIEQAKF